MSRWAFKDLLSFWSGSMVFRELICFDLKENYNYLTNRNFYIAEPERFPGGRSKINKK